MKGRNKLALLLASVLLLPAMFGCGEMEGSGHTPSETTSEVAGEYDIKIDTTIVGGQITVSKTKAKAGERIDVTVTPNLGYELRAGSLKMNQQAIVDNSFLMPEGEARITAIFDQLSYSLRVEETEGGTVSVDKHTAHAGDLIFVTVTPDLGNKLVAGSLKANGVLIENESFTMPAENVVITASFEEDADQILGNITLGSNTFETTSGFVVANGQASVAVDGQQYAFFRKATGKDLYAEATVKVNGKKEGEDFPRFGLALVSENKDSILFNVEGSNNLTNQQARVETGTFNLGGWTENFSWGAYMMKNNVGAYTGENSMKFTLIKYEGVIYFMINDALVGVRTFDGFAEGTVCGIALLSMETHLVFSSYSASAVKEEVAAKLPSQYQQIHLSEDWAAGLETQGVVGTEAYAGKSVTFQAALTTAGLHVRATAVHSKFVSGLGNWWTSTNFEFFVAGGNQFYISARNGITLSANLIGKLETEEIEGNLHRSVFEGFVDRSFLTSYISDNQIRVGFAWKTPGDLINNTQNSPNEYWLVAGHEANQFSQQFVVDADGIFASDSVESKFGSVTIGNSTFATTGGFNLSQDKGASPRVSVEVDGQQYAFFKDVAGTSLYAKTTINVTGKKADDPYPRFGLALVGGDKKVLLFNVEGSNNLTGQQSRIETGTFNLGGWTENFSWGAYMMANNVGAYTGEDSLVFEMVKYESHVYFFINGSLVGHKQFDGFDSDAVVCAALLTMETHAVFTNYSATTDAAEVVTHVPAI